jgi:hypothetical protein
MAQPPPAGHALVSLVTRDDKATAGHHEHAFNDDKLLALIAIKKAQIGLALPPIDNKGGAAAAAAMLDQEAWHSFIVLPYYSIRSS